MSGGGGQQQSYQQQTQNSTSTSAPSPVVQGPLQDIVKNFVDYYRQNPFAPDYYAGNTVADPSAATRAYWQRLSEVGHNGLGQTDAYNRQVATDTLRGDYLELSKNPYFQGALGASLRPQTEQFASQIVPSITSQFSGAGRTAYGGEGAHAKALGMAMDSLNRAQADAVTKAGSDMYSQERARQLQTQSMLPSFLGMDLARANAIGQAGREIDDWTQRNIDAQVLRDTYDKTRQLNYWSDAASRLLGAYPGGQTTSEGTSTGYSRLMQPSNGLASGLGIAGLALQALPLLGISDARAKDIEGRVGRTDEGLPLYLYRYKGDGEPRIGPVAQEVAELHPEAVARHPGGHLMIDYRRATPVGGLM